MNVRSKHIAIWAIEPARRRQLLEQSITDIIGCLGYDRISVRSERSGMEMIGHHRTEHKELLAVCRDSQAPIGVNEIRRLAPRVQSGQKLWPSTTELIGYCISLSGFTANALAASRETSAAVVLMDSTAIQETLVASRLVVSAEDAIEAAERYVASLKDATVANSGPTLAIMKFGWTWTVDIVRKDVSFGTLLVHADGGCLDLESAQAALADGVNRGARALGPSAHPHAMFAVDDIERRALDRYRAYLSAEFGFITLEGMPADQEAGSKRLVLESLYVPTHLVPVGDRHAGTLDRGEDGTEGAGGRHPTILASPREWITAGQALTQSTRLAVLSPPGGGKSTLIKRLATAYVRDEGPASLADDLPPGPWLPVVIRCRELGDAASKSIGEIIEQVAVRAEMRDAHEAMQTLILRALRAGEVLLLVDGLDEISPETRRIDFVRHLTTFLSVYPVAKAIVTSREAGFRLVAGMLATVCEQYTVSEFDDNDIRQLTVAWHREVVGSSESVTAEAMSLAEAVIANDRVRRLAVNPLLLTTLLLVKRWVGELPQRRSVLYGKAIEVLLMTWNVEGHERIELDEAIPQLAFLAYTMMAEAVQRVSRTRLRDILAESRHQMRDLLSFARIGIGDFVDRIEDRSSLLVLMGHDIEDGELRAFYEFKHLTFQEYLAARAVAEGFIPGGDDRTEVDGLLSPHFSDPQWREVIPLVAVLSGRRASSLIRALIRASQAETGFAFGRSGVPAQSSSLLARCIADEVQLPPEMLAEAIEWTVRRGAGKPDRHFDDILTSKYGAFMRERLRVMLGADNVGAYGIANALADVAARDVLSMRRGEFDWPVPTEVLVRCKELIASSDLHDHILGLQAIMLIAYHSKAWERRAERRNPDSTGILVWLAELVDVVGQDLHDEHEVVRVSAAWALAWLGLSGCVTLLQATRFLPILAMMWCRTGDLYVGRQFAWTIAAMPFVADSNWRLSCDDPASELYQFLHDEIESDLHVGTNRRAAATIVGYYMRDVWRAEELKPLMSAHKIERAWERGPAYDAIASLLGVEIDTSDDDR
jgi:hypothetical protein